MQQWLGSCLFYLALLGPWGHHFSALRVSSVNWALTWLKAVVLNLLGARNRFRGRQFFHRLGGGGRQFMQLCEQWGVMGSGRWSFTCLPTAHLLYSPVSNRPWTGTGLWSMGWGPLPYRIHRGWMERGRNGNEDIPISFKVRNGWTNCDSSVSQITTHQ